MSADTARIWHAPASLPLAEAAAQWLHQHSGAQAPNYSGIQLLAPQHSVLRASIAALAQRLGHAVLSPVLLTPDTLAATAPPALAPLSCQLRLAEALQSYTHLFPGQNLLALARAVYSLFSELESHGLALPATLPDLTAALSSGYAAPAELPALSREAQLLHHLHLAYREEIGQRSPHARTVQAVAQQLAHWPADTPLLVLGFDEWPAAWLPPLRHLLHTGRAQLLLHGPLTGRGGSINTAWLAALNLPAQALNSASTARSQLLNAAFSTEDTPLARAQQLQAGSNSSSKGLCLAPALDAENEAQLVDLAIRRALLNGARSIAVISQDRRLARRLRARLERAQVPLADGGGWALTTSRAAAAVHHWLGCVLQDFPLADLLALYRSGHLANGDALAQQLMQQAEAARQAGGLYALRAKAGAAAAAHYATLEQAAAPLKALAHGLHPASAYAPAILNGLEILGLTASLQADTAGAGVLAVLQQLADALANNRLQLRSSDFMALLDQCLEDASFTLAQQSPVRLLTLAQAQGLTAEVLILTGATAALLNPSLRSPFFNNSVRAELGLPTLAQRQALGMLRLRRLLEAAPEVLITWSPATPGEAPLLAPALEGLCAFAKAAGQPLATDHALQQHAAYAEVAHPSPPQPASSPVYANTSHSALLHTRGLSASAHQSLVNCPYQFHAAYALGLSDTREPDADPDRSDYGQAVHRILRAFYQQQPDAPPAWQGPLAEAQQPAISQRLAEHGAHEFAALSRTQPLGAIWQQMFMQAVPWLSTQIIEAGAPPLDMEVTVDTQLPSGVRLRGSIDRLEGCADGSQRVVDYKSGRLPKNTELLAGEAIQLPHYALATGNASSVAYWSLKEQKTLTLDRPDLDRLTQLLAERLTQLQHQFYEGSPLPAHGTAAVCDTCSFPGLCRNSASQRRSV